MSRYRTVDGSCNNPSNPLYGMAGTPFQRILEATYPRGDNTPRKARDGAALPSARTVSTTVFQKGDRKDPDISSQFMQMGQFLDHDLTHTPTSTAGGRPPQCCLPDRRDRDWAYPTHPFNDQQDVCFPIEVPGQDRFWGRKGRRCMHVARSLPAPTINPVCESGRWEQENAITHWLDGSNIYGSTATESEDVRHQEDRGLMARSRTHELLPSCARVIALARGAHAPESCPQGGSSTDTNFVGGDFRVNEQPMLTVQHTVWVREHNRIAAELRRINPGWRGERLFQETRRIVVAEWQNIVYGEWLPILLGSSYMGVFGLFPLTQGYSEDYDPEFDPRINNEFATAAFRFAHSLVPSHVPNKDSRGRNTTSLHLKQAFNQGARVGDDNFIADTVRGLTQDRVPALDGSFVEDIVDHLFEGDEGTNGGLDLPALNIQRGRDHGIPGYNQYREECAARSSNFSKAADFGQLTQGKWLSSEDVKKLRSVYAHVDDIDLYAGGILEEAHRSALVGPTFKCIIGDQFVRLKRGDRFWFENGADPRTRFSLAQLDSLRRVSEARIMCDNTDIRTAQPLMFRVPTAVNELVSCDAPDIPRLDLTLWKE